MPSVRLDVTTEAALNRLSAERGQSKSEVIRDAIALLAEPGKEKISAYDRLLPFLGIADSGGQQLSEDTGRQVKELLERKHRARRSG